MTTKKCVKCNREFEAKQQRALYCSRKCKNDSRGYRGKKEKPGIRKPKIDQNQSTTSRMKKVQPDQLNLVNDILARLDQIIAAQRTIMTQTEQYLVPSKVCSLLSINRSTFDRFTREGIFRIYRLGKGKVYVKRSEIDQLFQVQETVDQSE